MMLILEMRINVQIKKIKRLRGEKKKKKKTLNTKDHNEEFNNSTKHNGNKNIDSSIDHNSTASSPESKEAVFILGDHVFKKVNGFYVTNNINTKIQLKWHHLAQRKPCFCMATQTND